MGTSHKQGDIIRVNLDQQVGHEQKGKRPAVVVSGTRYNQIENTLLICPITTTPRNIPWYVALDNRTKTQGYVMTNQQKCLDLDARNAEFIERLPRDILEEVLYTLSIITSLDEDVRF